MNKKRTKISDVRKYAKTIGFTLHPAQEKIVMALINEPNLDVVMINSRPFGRTTMRRIADHFTKEGRTQRASTYEKPKPEKHA